MRKTKEQNAKNHGITLIALVITIIVMIILVAVTVTMAVNGGLFSKAQTAGIKTNEAVALEQELGNGRIKIGGTWYDSPQDYVNNNPSANHGNGESEDETTEGETEEDGGSETETTSPYIGCYVCVDKQYGVIYADLAYSKSGKWGDSAGAYSYEAEDPEKLKKYNEKGTYDPGDEYGTAWGEKPLLVADEEINETEGRTIDRFYVMALTNYTTEDYTTFYWDCNYNGIDFGTSTNFGTGKDNTELLVNTTEATWANQDIWKNLSNTSVWFVPSKTEWSAFAQEIGITSSTYSSYGLSDCYWSSSQFGAGNTWMANFRDGYVDFSMVDDVIGPVRLCTTF